MVRYLVRRVAQALGVVVGVMVLTFLIQRVVPGDPAVAVAGPKASPEQLAEVQAAARARPVAAGPAVALRAGACPGRPRGEPAHAPSGDARPGDGVSGLARARRCRARRRRCSSGSPRAWSRRGTGAGPVTSRSGSAACWPCRCRRSGSRCCCRRSSRRGSAGSRWRVSTPASLDQTSPLHVYTNLTLVDALLTGNWPIVTSVLGHLVPAGDRRRGLPDRGGRPADPRRPDRGGHARTTPGWSAASGSRSGRSSCGSRCGLR